MRTYRRPRSPPDTPEPHMVHVSTRIRIRRSDPVGIPGIASPASALGGGGGGGGGGGRRRRRPRRAGRPRRPSSRGHRLGSCSSRGAVVVDGNMPVMVPFVVVDGAMPVMAP